MPCSIFVDVEIKNPSKHSLGRGLQREILLYLCALLDIILLTYLMVYGHVNFRAYLKLPWIIVLKLTSWWHSFSIGPIML